MYYQNIAKLSTHTSVIDRHMISALVFLEHFCKFQMEDDFTWFYVAGAKV